MPVCVGAANANENANILQEHARSGLHPRLQPITPRVFCIQDSLCIQAVYSMRSAVGTAEELRIARVSKTPLFSRLSASNTLESKIKAATAASADGGIAKCSSEKLSGGGNSASSVCRSGTSSHSADPPTHDPCRLGPTFSSRFNRRLKIKATLLAVECTSQSYPTALVLSTPAAHTDRRMRVYCRRLFAPYHRKADRHAPFCPISAQLRPESYHSLA